MNNKAIIMAGKFSRHFLRSIVCFQTESVSLNKVIICRHLMQGSFSLTLHWYHLVVTFSLWTKSIQNMRKFHLRELSFFTGRGGCLSVIVGCHFFSGPPFTRCKKFWPPLYICKKKNKKNGHLWVRRKTICPPPWVSSIKGAIIFYQ